MVRSFRGNKNLLFSRGANKEPVNFRNSYQIRRAELQRWSNPSTKNKEALIEWSMENKTNEVNPILRQL